MTSPEDHAHLHRDVEAARAALAESLRVSEARLDALQQMAQGMIDAALAGGQKIARATAALEEAVLMLLALDAITMSRAAELLGVDVVWTRDWYNRNADKAAAMRATMMPAAAAPEVTP